jgi:hypothetical protein
MQTTRVQAAKILRQSRTRAIRILQIPRLVCLSTSPCAASFLTLVAPSFRKDLRLCASDARNCPLATTQSIVAGPVVAVQTGGDSRWSVSCPLAPSLRVSQQRARSVVAPWETQTGVSAAYNARTRAMVMRRVASTRTDVVHSWAGSCAFKSLPCPLQTGDLPHCVYISTLEGERHR